MSIEMKITSLDELVQDYDDVVDEPQLDEQRVTRIKGTLSQGDVIRGYDGRQHEVQDAFLETEEGLEDYLFDLTGRRWDLIIKSSQVTGAIYSEQAQDPSLGRSVTDAPELGQIAGLIYTYEGEMKHYTPSDFEFQRPDILELSDWLTEAREAHSHTGRAKKRRSVDRAVLSSHYQLIKSAQHYLDAIDRVEDSIDTVVLVFAEGERGLTWKEFSNAPGNLKGTQEKHSRFDAKRLSFCKWIPGEQDLDEGYLKETPEVDGQSSPQPVSSVSEEREETELHLAVGAIKPIIEHYDDHDGDGKLSVGDYIRGTRGRKVEVRSRNIESEAALERFLFHITGRRCDILLNPDDVSDPIVGALVYSKRIPDSRDNRGEEQEQTFVGLSRIFREEGSNQFVAHHYTTEDFDLEKADFDYEEYLIALCGLRCKEKWRDAVIAEYLVLAKSAFAYEEAARQFEDSYSALLRAFDNESVKLGQVDTVLAAHQVQIQLHENYEGQRAHFESLRSEDRSPYQGLSDAEMRSLLGFPEK